MEEDDLWRTGIGMETAQPQRHHTLEAQIVCTDTIMEHGFAVYPRRIDLLAGTDRRIQGKQLLWNNEDADIVVRTIVSCKEKYQTGAYASGAGHVSLSRSMIYDVILCLRYAYRQLSIPIPPYPYPSKVVG